MQHFFADYTSLFTIVKDKNESDFFLISKWAFNWKMPFNPDPNKPAQEVLFSRKKKVSIHLTITLSDIKVKKAPYQKHLGIYLDEKLTFKHHIDDATRKVNKGITVIKTLSHILL